MEKLTEVKVAIVAAFGAMSAFLGWFGWLCVVFVLAMLVDYFTGSAVAMKEKNWSSGVAFNGIWRKVGSILAVLVAGGADFMLWQITSNIPGITLPFAVPLLFCPLVLTWYILTEFGSIMENIGKLGAPLPAFLVKIIKVLTNAAEEAGGKIDSDKE